MTKARRGRNGKADKDARHVRLYHWVLGSEAWQSLNPNARAAYIELASKYAGGGSNNGRIGCSVRQIANALHIGKATAQKALADLQERGFIVAMQKGAFNWKTGAATEWRLTEFTCDVTNELATKDFMKWQPRKQSPVPVTELTGTCSRTARYPTPNRSTVTDPKRYLTPNREQRSSIRHGSDSGTLVVYQGDDEASEAGALSEGVGLGSRSADHLKALYKELEGDGLPLPRISADLAIAAEDKVAEYGARAAAVWLRAELAGERPP
jgi:hypothetical protein